MNERTPQTPTSHFFSSLRTRLHYLDWGNPTAPTLILVHGGFDHAHSWDWVARELSKDYHVVALDLRGHGDSGWASDGNYSIISFVYDLALLIDLIGRDPVTIVSHSLGGSISLRFTGMYPEKVKQIVAIEGMGLSPSALQSQDEAPAVDRAIEWIAARRSRAQRPGRTQPTIEAAVQRMRDRNDQLTAEQALHLTIHGVNRNEDGSYSWKFDPYLRTTNPHSAQDCELPQFWQRISCPVLLCLGLNSWASNPETDGRAANFQNARLAKFPDAGHWLHHDQFEMFMDELRAFLT